MSHPIYFSWRSLAAGAALTLLLVFNVLLGERNGRMVAEGTTALAEAHEVVAALDRVLISALDAETAVRGFVISGRESYLEPYDAELPRFDGELARLEALYAQHPDRRAELAVLRRNLSASQLELRQIIEDYRAEGQPAAAIRLATGRNEATMEAVRANVREIEAQAQGDIAVRSADARASTRVARIASAVTGGLGVLAALGFVWAAHRSADVQAEAAARVQAEREQLRVTLASIGDGVVVTDRDGRVAILNFVAQHLTGWTEADAMGAPLERVFHIVNEETRQPLENPVGRAIRDGVIVGLANHAVLVSKDGTERPIADSAAPIRDARGGIRGAVLVFRDVTEARAREVALNRSLSREQDWSHRLRQVAAASLTINSAMTQESIVGVIDAEARRLLGAGKCRVVFSEDALPREPGHLIVPLIHRSGRRLGYIQCSDKAHGGFDEDDRAMLTQLAQMASIAIQNSRLYTEIRTNDARKDAFLATLAHELRNPLAPISTSLQALRATSDPIQQEASRAIIERQVGQLVHLVDDLLDVARINEGKLELRRRRVKLAHVLRAAVETSRPIIEAQGHTLRLEAPGEDVWLDADLTRLSQVFANLLNNSAKYTEPGGAITIAAQADAREVSVVVRDPGVGIAPDLLPHVFDMFVQADRSLERAQGGLGIGLTLVKQIVQLHGGSVSASSEGVGKGSEFVVTLPRSEAPGQRPEPTSVAHSEPIPSRRVLVVDDNRDAVESLTLLLKLTGQEVASATDGREALVRFASFKPDVVVLDIGLPVMNGYDVAREMRAISPDRRVMLVALTGWGQDEDRRRTIEAGFDHHLVKPVDFEALKALLASLPGPR